MSRTLIASVLIGAVLFGVLAYMFAPLAVLFMDSRRQWHAYYVSSESMLPTLEVGDRVFPRIVTPSDLQRGTVVLFRTEEGEARIARIAAVGGDTIAMQDGHVVLNGQDVAQTEAGEGPAMKDGTRAHVLVEQLPGEPGQHRVLDLGPTQGDDTDPVKVPEGSLFLLGDNRDNAADSRYPTSAFGAGVVPTDRVLGVMDAVAWPASGWKFARPIDRFTPAHP